MKVLVTVEIEVNAQDIEFAQYITSEMDYSFSFKNGHLEELITSTEIQDIEIL